ncbi:MAG TPA: AAA family ATPase, partial [Candidatus Binatus sp.]|nr:AAA family ATPase [Candidatus Binatus sp.]
MEHHTGAESVNMPRCSLDTLGAFALRVDGRPVAAPSTQKARALLAYLVMRQGTDIARERLLELFWPDADPDRARDSLRTALYSIRRSLRDAHADPDELLSTTKSVVRWNPQTVLDSDRFTELAKQQTADTLAEALALYRGDFLEGDYDDWTVVERERLSAAYEGALARALVEHKQPAIAGKLLERNPYEESAYAALIDVALAEGRRLAAVQAFRQCRSALAEIGAEPSAEFTRRFAHLERVAPVATQTPRLGYVGREAALGELGSVLSRAVAGTGAVVMVSGEPGIGKSAFLTRAEEIAREAGLRVLRIGFLANDPRPFGAWGSLFESLVERKFYDFVKGATGSAVDAIVPVLVGALNSPTVLLADDAQYLNDEALSLLAGFAQLVNGAGHAVVVTTRPEGRARLDRAIENIFGLQLERLTADQLQDALETVGFDVNPVLAEALFKRTSGNPMFIESLLDAFVKKGDLQRDGGRWRFTSSPGTDIALPGTLSRTIESRLRSRGPSAAAVACALSLEPEASADDLQAVLELDETAVLDALDDLLSLEVLDQPSSGPMFAFSHDLLRERARTLLNVARRIR